MSDSQRTRLLVLTLVCALAQLGVVLAVAVVGITGFSIGGSYRADLFRGFVLLGLAIPFLLVPTAIAALTAPKVQHAGSEEAASRST
jgi:hypothetical protein